MTTSDWRIRPGRTSDRSLLEAMLIEAACWRSAERRPPSAEMLARPELAIWLADWGGREGDTAVVAEGRSGVPLGAAWFRFWSVDRHSYGFVSPDVPELAIGVYALARGRGVGRNLLKALLAAAAVQGIARVSLSVEVDNPALRLYRRVGFQTVGRSGNAWTMQIDPASSRDGDEAPGAGTREPSDRNPKPKCAC